MDSRLLNYYADELKYLREAGWEFAKEFPKVAGRLSLDEFTCADPYVERLLEGFAFLSARVQLKLDSEFPRLTQGLLESICPRYLSPTPSMCVVQFQPDVTEPALFDGYPVPRETALRSLLGQGQRTACEYRTAHDVTLYPLSITQARYLTRELESLDLPGSLGPRYSNTRAAIHLRLQCHGDKGFDAMKLDELKLFIRGTSETQSRIYEQLFAHAKAVVIQPTGKPVLWREVVPVTSGKGLRRVGFDDAEALLPRGSRSFQGYRLLHEYFAFPQRFLFFGLGGLSAGLKRCKDKLIDLVILLDSVEPHLEGAVDPTNFAPFCTPAINLFPKRCDRIHVSDRVSELHVVVDKIRPLAYEVYDVTAIEGFTDGSVQGKPFLPLYSARNSGGEDSGAYFTFHRVPRTEWEKEKKEKQGGNRSKYGGSEVYLSLVDGNEAPYSDRLRQLGVQALCTNRDLPLFLPIGRMETDFNIVDGSGPVVSIRSVSGAPTPPRPSWAEGQTAWRLISHLSLNYLSLVDSDRGDGAAALRELLALYGELADPHVRKQIDGVRSISASPVIRRLPLPGPISFGRGMQVDLTLDEASFEGTGAFLLGTVLDVFFSKYVSINSFTETVVKTMERGQIMHWPARFGRRHLI